MTTLLQQLNQELGELAQVGRRSLVQVRNGARGVGSGTIWHPDGLIVTNAHVVGEGRDLRVGLPDGRVLPAKTVAWDPSCDLAALTVEATGLPSIQLGNSRSLEPGQWVLALGHPWGVAGAVAAGVVVGVGNLGQRPRGQGEWIAVNLPLRPGNSGGPLLDVQGRLVGINAMISGPQLGLAVPVHVAKAFLKRTLVSGLQPQPVETPAFTVLWQK